MYKFIITIELQPEARDRILGRAAEAQAATRVEPGCLAYDFFTCTDDSNKLVFVETWKDEAAHAFHMQQQYTKDFIAFHEQFHRNLTFETINAASVTC
jgi:quinol monooxygenase YgiN